MREKDVLAPENGEDEEETAKDHEEDQCGEDEAEERRQEGVNVFQPYHRNIPEQKDEDEQNDTGKD
jgi:hypothetical protein